MALLALHRILTLLVLLTAGALFVSWPEPRATPPVTRGPYVQLATADGATVVWRTQHDLRPKVVIKSADGALVKVVEADQIKVRRTKGEGGGDQELVPLDSAPEGTRQYEAGVAGLQPATAYTYTLWDGGEPLGESATEQGFTTHPVVGSPRGFTFWAIGDTGVSSASQRAVFQSLMDWEKENKPVDFGVHLGDMAYNFGSDSEFQYTYFEVYKDRLKSLMMWPAMGNHEGVKSKGTTGVGPYFDAYICPSKGEAGGLASGTEAYYSWDYGRTHFICLNSHDAPRQPQGPMATWLKADLERTKADWIIAYFHHPAYTKGSHDSDKEKDLMEMRQFIMPILESGGVDLVMCGHSHIYERSMLMDGAYATPTVAQNVILDDRMGDETEPYRKRPGLLANEGTVQIVAGHGGQMVSRKAKPCPVMKRTIVEWGSVLVTVEGLQLTARMLDVRGTERDVVVIKKDATQPPQRLGNPQPPLPAEGPERLKDYRQAVAAGS